MRADLLSTADAVNLIFSKTTEDFSPQVDSIDFISVIPAKFRDSEHYWFGLTNQEPEY